MDIEAPLASPIIAVKPHSFHTKSSFKSFFFYTDIILCQVTMRLLWAVDSVIRGRIKNDKYSFDETIVNKAQESTNLYKF